MPSSADDDPSFKTPLEDVEPLECYRPRGYHGSLVADNLSEKKNDAERFKSWLSIPRRLRAFILQIKTALQK